MATANSRPSGSTPVGVAWRREVPVAIARRTVMDSLLTAEIDGTDVLSSRARISAADVCATLTF